MSHDTLSSDISISVNSNTGNKKHATCFAALLQNELNSNAVRFTTQEKNLATLFDAGQVRMWVVKRATWLFNSFCSNVADLLQTC